MKLRRLPFDPLWRHCLLRYGTVEWRTDYWEGFTSERAADMLGCSVHLVRQMQCRGVSVWQADRYAIAFGSHPLLIWGSEWVEAALFDDLDRVAA